MRNSIKMLIEDFKGAKTKSEEEAIGAEGS